MLHTQILTHTPFFLSSYVVFFCRHKNKVLFWLTQLSFVTTTGKYVVSLLLTSASASNDADENFAMSVLLITLDCFFMVSSVVAMIVSIFVLRSRLRIINKQTKDNNHNGTRSGSSAFSSDSSASSLSNTKVLPMLSHVDQEEDQKQTEDLHAIKAQFGVKSDEYTSAASALRETREHISIVANLDKEHKLHQQELSLKLKKKQIKQRRNTQQRIEQRALARAKLKKLKIFAQIEAFANLKDEELQGMLCALNVLLCSLKPVVWLY